MASGERHDEQSIRHEATFRRRLAAVQAEIAEIKKAMKALPVDEPGYAELLAKLRRARARASRLRNAPKVRR